LKLKKILFFIIGAVLLYAAYIGLSLLFLPSVDSLKDRRMSMTIRVRDWNGNYHPFVVGPKNPYWTKSSAIPPEMKWAVILAEDARFYKHEGIDVKAIKNAIKYDLEKKSLARGASTITQQVAKNLFLSREKTLSRKAKEIVLARRMEEQLTKGRILELYLNVVELGPMVYGIGHGARYYFGKPASSLTPRECAFLAAMLPGPRIVYNPYRNLDKVVHRSDGILRLLRRKGILTEGEYRLALSQQPNVLRLQQKVDESIKKEEAFANLTGAVMPEPALQDMPQQPEGEGSEPLAVPESGTSEDAAPAYQEPSQPDQEGQGGGN
jgi:monofunctional biosynthetic peptidoglycan transglycosylase